MILTRTEQIWLKTSENLSRLCHLSKNLYNEGNYLIRQEFFTNEKWLRYNSLYHLLKSSKNYQYLPAQTAQQVLKILERNWKSFFQAIKVWGKEKEKFLGKPRLPKYKLKNGEFMLIFTNQQVKIKAKVLLLPQKVGLAVKTRLSDTTKLREVRILPKGIGYVLEIVYQKIVNPKSLNKANALAIDLGVRNLITTVNNNGFEPFVIKGGVIKSINQYYNKKKVRLQSTYDQQDLKTGKALLRLTTKRNNRINDYFHKTTRNLIAYCLNKDIGTLIIGYNSKWKQNCHLGKKNTQNFVTIPYYKLIHQLDYKATEQGITVIRQEESHSSKCSFLDNEPITHHTQYVGKRISRGLFRSKKGVIINADVNGAYNILKKALPNTVAVDGIEAVGLHPTRWRLVTATS